MIASMPELLEGVGRLDGHVVKLQVDTSVKPVASPPRRVPYHLKSRVGEVVEGMLTAGIIEQHPAGEPAPWTSNLVIVPKDDGGIRVTLDAKNVNKALLSSNFPIPRQEDIKASLSGSKVFSKLDLKSAFWQLEIQPEARHLTVFHSGGRLYRYKRLVMGLKPSQGELNAALQPLFCDLPEVHVIHDDIIIATPVEASHLSVLIKVLSILRKKGLTLNPDKCQFGANEIKFWGLMVSAEGVRPDPEKVAALDHLTTPRNKEELVSFLCMMQSNSDFIKGFSRKANILRELTKKDVPFHWEKQHDDCFKELLNAFREDVLMRYFDCNLNTFVFVDGHRTGLGAILAQGNTMYDAKPVAVASRCTSPAEFKYPQLDVEAASVDFGLRRFREYLVGSPTLVKVVTDHKPLLPVFNGKRTGSIRTQRIKLNHQNVPYIMGYQKGSLNRSDIMSRQARPLSSISLDQQKEAHELNNLLYMLHATPIVDHITLGEIARETDSDPVLARVRQLLNQGARSASKNDNAKVQKFNPVLSQMTVTGNGILLKDDRIVLPEALQRTAIQLAHKGSHPGRSGIERRLRFHFFFHDMFAKVQEFVLSCSDCASFVEKKTKEPIQPHKVPETAWEAVSVDLFGPMPSSRHVVVVQDIGSRYPAAKLVSSTKSSEVIPALDEVYTEYGYPELQISDNGPPFNSTCMKEYAEAHGIDTQFSAPYCPSQNPSETFMKTIGKSMKVSKHDRASEEKAIRDTLKTYRQTPHPATGIPPANFIFRDGVKTEFPRKPSSSQVVSQAREKDAILKKTRQDAFNSSKYVRHDQVERGDVVLVKDAARRSKFSPVYLPDPFVVVEVAEGAKHVVLQCLRNQRRLVRHLNDVKIRFGHNSLPGHPQSDASREVIGEEMVPCGEVGDDDFDDGIQVANELPPTDSVTEIRRSNRERRAPAHYSPEEWVV